VPCYLRLKVVLAGDQVGIVRNLRGLKLLGFIWSSLSAHTFYTCTRLLLLWVFLMRVLSWILAKVLLSISVIILTTFVSQVDCPWSVVRVVHIRMRILADLSARSAAVTLVQLTLVLARVTSSTRRPLSVFNTRGNLHNCGLLVAHEIGVLKLRNFNLHYVLNEVVHLSLVALDFINIYYLVVLQVLQKLAQIVLHQVIRNERLLLCLIGVLFRVSVKTNESGKFWH